MLRRVLCGLVIAVAFWCVAGNSPGAPADASTQPGARWWSHVKFLADDKLEGRLTGSEGHRKAAQYIADEFKRAGLEPAGTPGYFQPVGFHSRRIVEEQSSLVLLRGGKAELLTLGEDAIISMRVAPAAKLEAPLVFAGYGLTVPELNYNDLAGLDLRGKIVLYVSGGPASIPGELRSHYQSTEQRWKSLKAAGALGTIAVQDPRHMDIPWARIALSRFQPAMSLSDPGLDETPGDQLSVILNPAHADKFFAGSGHTFGDLMALADAGKPLPTFPLPASLRAKAGFEQTEVVSQNVAGILRGSDPELKNEYVVLSAHLDHLGVGEPIHGDRIYNGAMDNASGVATLLDIAASLHDSKLRRSLLFLSVTGEEKGLLGSRYFVAHPTVNMRSVVADVNIDMFLPIFPLRILMVEGLKESDLGPLLASIAEPQGLKVQGDPEPERNLFIRSDQYNFILAGVPSIKFNVGFEKGSPQAAIQKKWLTERYHAPSDDTKQPVDLRAADAYNQIVLWLAEAIANGKRPQWNDHSFFRRFAVRLTDAPPAFRVP